MQRAGAQQLLHHPQRTLLRIGLRQGPITAGRRYGREFSVSHFRAS
jgi:hypothetical protein